jgi:hypothetical protein
MSSPLKKTTCNPENCMLKLFHLSFMFRSLFELFAKHSAEVVDASNDSWCLCLTGDK